MKPLAIAPLSIPPLSIEAARSPEPVRGVAQSRPVDAKQRAAELTKSKSLRLASEAIARTKSQENFEAVQMAYNMGWIGAGYGTFARFLFESGNFSTIIEKTWRELGRRGIGPGNFKGKG